MSASALFVSLAISLASSSDVQNRNSPIYSAPLTDQQIFAKIKIGMAEQKVEVIIHKLLPRQEILIISEFHPDLHKKWRHWLGKQGHMIDVEFDNQGTVTSKTIYDWPG
jgi:hypothetical protein